MKFIPNRYKLSKFEERIVQDATVSVVSITTMFMVMNFDIGFEVGTIAFLVGLGLACVGCIDIVLAIRKNKKLPNLMTSQTGIVYIWFVIAVTIGFMAIVWWVISYPLWLIIQTMEGVYTYPAEAIGTINLVKNVITYFLAFVVLGCVIYGLVASFRREDIQTPLG